MIIRDKETGVLYSVLIQQNYNADYLDQDPDIDEPIYLTSEDGIEIYITLPQLMQEFEFVRKGTLNGKEN